VQSTAPRKKKTLRRARKEKSNSTYKDSMNWGGRGPKEPMRKKKLGKKNGQETGCAEKTKMITAEGRNTQEKGAFVRAGAVRRNGPDGGPRGSRVRPGKEPWLGSFG